MFGMLRGYKVNLIEVHTELVKIVQDQSAVCRRAHHTEL